MHNPLALLSVLALSAAVVAQQGYLPVDAATAATGTSGNYFNSPAAGSTHQSIYDSSHFTAQGIFVPVVINNLSWRAGAAVVNVAQTWPMVDVWVGYSATDYLTPDVTFANNRTASHTHVYSGPITSTVASGGTPNDWVINLPLTTTFTYDPSLGQDLLVEILITGAPTPAGALTLDTAYDVAAYKCQAVRSPTSGTATTGALNRFVPTVRFGYTPVPNSAWHESYGEGCYKTLMSYYEAFPGAFPLSSNDLSGHTVIMNPNTNGGYDVFTIPANTFVPPSGTAVGLGLPDDGPSGALPLGFTFHYPGGNSTTAVYAHSNGSVTLNIPGDVYMNNGSSGANLLTNVDAGLNPVHTLSPSMQDLLCDGAANIQNVFVEGDGSTYLTITWNNVPPFLTVPVANPDLSRFQVVLFSDDHVEFRYDVVYNESDSYGGGMVTGFSLGGAQDDPGSRDLTGGLVSTGNTILPLKLTPSGRPVLGNPITYGLTNIVPNTGVSLMLASFGQFNPGVDLPLLGVAAPGCNAYVNPVGAVNFGPILVGSPTAGFNQTWPTGPWNGLTIYVQGFELAPGQNPVGVLVSNGVKAVLNPN